MNDELEQHLHRLAAQVPDDGPQVARIGAQTRGMVARIRRRRAARRGAVVMLSVGAVAVLGVGGVLAAQHAPRVAPPASTTTRLHDEPVDPPTTVSAPEELCGLTLAETGWADASTEVRASAPARLVGTTGSTVALTGTVGTGLAGTIPDDGLVLAVDTLSGRVVGQAVLPLTLDASGIIDTTADLVGCTGSAADDGSLLAGGFALYLSVPTRDGDGVGRVVGGPWDVTPSPDAVGPQFPTCRAEETGRMSLADTGLALRVDDLPDGVRAGTSTALTATVEALAGWSVIANVGEATLVYVHDGLVVGSGTSGETGTGHVDLLELSPGAASDVTGRTRATACDGLPLAPGTYTAYPVLPVHLKEVTTAGVTTQPSLDSYVVGDAVTVTVR